MASDDFLRRPVLPLTLIHSVELPDGDMNLFCDERKK